MDWFQVDRQGLGKLLERRGKQWIAAELLQNAWDAPGVRNVALELTPVPGRPLAELRIEDDSPAGFADLTHSFTLFSESIKKGDPELRGRFNLGEKLVLALCETAQIASTTGTVVFDAQGRREHPRRKREAGTEFRAVVRMTRDEVAATLLAVWGFIAPADVRTTVNGVRLATRVPLRSFEHVLQTEVAGPDGVLRRSRRKTRVSVHEPLDGMPGRIYEMGIPIVETGDRFDVDVGQKVPLSLERDAVTPSYLRDVRVAVLNHTADILPPEAAAQPWVGDAIEDPECAPEAVRAVVRGRYGDKVVSYDPSDREANERAVASGYVVVHGGAFSRTQWDGIRAAEAMLPAGRVTPTPKPFSPDGPPAQTVEATPAMQAFAGFAKEIGRRLLGREVAVVFYRHFNASAAYGQGALYFNVGRLGKAWFDGPLREAQLDLLIHEFGHEYESNHLSKKYNDALTKLGARAALVALEAPHVFDLDRYRPEARQDHESVPVFGPR